MTGTLIATRLVLRAATNAPAHAIASGRGVILSAPSVEEAALRAGDRARRLETRGLDQLVPRRELARRIGRGSIAGQRKRLAAAPAEVDRPAVAALAGFGHPRFAAVREERLGRAPDLGERPFFHAVEPERSDA